MGYIKYVNTIHIMSGVPGSGKSTWAQAHMDKNDIYLSRDKFRDTLREERHSEEYFPVPRLEEYANWIELLGNAIKTAPNICDIWIDQTSCSTGSVVKLINFLKPWLEIIPKEREYEFLIEIMDVPFEECISRNSGRQKRECVPEAVIKNMWRTKELSHKKIRTAAAPHKIDFRFIDQYGHIMEVAEF